MGPGMAKAGTIRSDTLGGGLGATGSQELQEECGDLSMRLRICREATNLECPALSQNLRDIRLSCPPQTQTSHGLNSLALDNCGRKPSLMRSSSHRRQGERPPP